MEVFPFLKRKIEFKGEPLVFYEAGEGPVVFLLHGYLFDALCWKHLMADLAKTYRVICPDLPGHGDSGCWGYVHSMDFMAECVYAILQHLRLKKCSMFGHSMGGYVTLAFAEKYPDKLRQYGLLFSTPLPDSEEKKRDRVRAMQFLKKKKILYIKETFKNLFQQHEIKYFRDDYIRCLNRAMDISPRGAIAALRGMMNRPDREVVIKFSPVPVLMLNGKQDAVLPYSAMEKIKKRNPKIRFIMEEGLGHMGFIEYPAFCIHVLRSFLSQNH
ncbi:MAG: alpha/beta hydrolase [Bacteroidia bacterium]|nr:alpha/beta hydrolase [Bacteroidia bacterium]